MASARRWRAAVLTVSDACAAGRRADRSGPAASARLEGLPAEVVWHDVVPDDVEAIRAAATTAIGRVDILVTTGGTGLAPRDRTPEALAPLLDRLIPGMAEAMRAHGAGHTAHAMLSRQVVGARGACLVLALPGSPRAVEECLDAVWEALPHALHLLCGGLSDHDAPAQASPPSE